MTTIDTIEVITDDINKPYKLYISYYKNEKKGSLVIRLSKLPGVRIPKNCKPLNKGDIYI